MGNANTTVRSGMGFLDALTLVFVILKLTRYIDWSWWWVLSPIWIPFVLFVGIFVLIAAFSGRN